MYNSCNERLSMFFFYLVLLTFNYIIKMDHIPLVFVLLLVHLTIFRQMYFVINSKHFFQIVFIRSTATNFGENRIDVGSKFKDNSLNLYFGTL